MKIFLFISMSIFNIQLGMLYVYISLPHTHKRRYTKKGVANTYSFSLPIIIHLYGGVQE